MRPLPRLIPTPVAGASPSTPSRAASEIAVAVAFVVVLLAVGLYADRRAASANADQFIPEWLDGGAGARPPACQAVLRGKRHRSLATLAIDASGARCPDPRFYV